MSVQDRCTEIMNYTLYESNLILRHFKCDVNYLWLRPVSVNKAAVRIFQTHQSLVEVTVFFWKDLMWCSLTKRDRIYIYSQMGAVHRDGHSSEKCTCQPADTQTICGFVNGVNTATHQGCRSTSDTKLGVTSYRKCDEKARDWYFSPTLYWRRWTSTLLYRPGSQ